MARATTSKSGVREDDGTAAEERRVTGTLPARLHPVCDWLLRGVSEDFSAEGLLDGLNQRLLASHIPVWRSSLNIHTFHPELFVRNLVWSRGEGCRSQNVSHFDTLLPIFKNSPVAMIYEGADAIRRRLRGPRALLDFPILEELARQGATDYFILPLEFSDGRRTFVSFCTDAEGGFDDAAIATLHELTPYLALRIELESANFAKSSLLQLYLGRSAAAHVLAGNFKRGHGQHIEAAIWFCDLRNFTQMTSQHSGDRVVEMLDRYFELVANAIRDQGGEILKFIGDAVLASFDFDRFPEPSDAADGALISAERAMADIRDWNDAGLTPDLPIQIGIALHAGRVMFGNIGSRERLDFTVIGSAVNEVCRLEPLCKAMNVPLVLSEDFARLTTREDLRSLGRHELRGVDGQKEAFALRASPA